MSILQRNPQPLLDETFQERDRAERAERLDNVTIRMAKAQIGRAVTSAIGGEPLKAFGSPSLVATWCQGEGASAIVRLWADPVTRRKLLVGLCVESGLADVETVIRFKESA